MNSKTYRNGNVKVTISDDGSRVFQYKGRPNFELPVSVDLKVTNHCVAPCFAWCHEQSNVKGIHANLEQIKPVLSVLDAGSELAIGGGATQSHPDIISFIEWVKGRGLYANATMNAYHFEYDFDRVYSVCKSVNGGVGVSYHKRYLSNVKKIYSDNFVFHLIAGVHRISDFEFLRNEFPFCKILVLGFKTYGNGVSYAQNNDVKPVLLDWYRKAYKLFGDGIVSFDNLAIEQINPQRFLKNWRKFYNGDDGSNTMYVDAVEMEYARTSRSEERFKFNCDSKLSKMFQSVKIKEEYE